MTLPDAAAADGSSSAVWSPDEASYVSEFVDSHGDELIAFRRRIHAHPELSAKEFAITEALMSRLQVAHLSPLVLPSGTGVICDVGASADDASADGNAIPTVALRADIDALAMDDETLTRYRSQVPGVAHACGHDVHTTIVLGAGLVLAKLLGRPGAPVGRVRLFFEPSEETVPGGAVEIIESGYLDGVGVVFGLHCDPKVDLGSIGLIDGPITSAADIVEIGLSGPGGHTARPERTIDLVAVAGRVASQVPELLAKGVNGHGPLRMVFGALRAGNAPNVIPTSAKLYGTLRARNREDWERGPKLLEDAIEQVVGSTGATWTLRHDPGVPPVVNETRATQLLATATRAALGPDSVVATDQSWGGDSFAWFLQRVPGSYARLGVHDPQSNGPRLDLHASTFEPDERAIGIGVRVMVAVALGWLRSQGQNG